MRSISVASRDCSLPTSKPGANSRITQGAASTATAVRTSKAAIRVPATRSTSSLTAAWSCFSLYSARTGTKAIENEPSADSRRMKLGIRNATTNASMAGLAPNTAA